MPVQSDPSVAQRLEDAFGEPVYSLIAEEDGPWTIAVFEGEKLHALGEQMTIESAREHLEQMFGPATRRTRSGSAAPVPSGEPITPEHATQLADPRIPEVVLTVVNRLIADKLANGQAYLEEQEIIARLVELGLDEQEIKARGWLRIEPAYRDAGWKIHAAESDACDAPAGFLFQVPPAAGTRIRQRRGPY